MSGVFGGLLVGGSEVLGWSYLSVIEIEGLGIGRIMCWGRVLDVDGDLGGLLVDVGAVLD